MKSSFNKLNSYYTDYTHFYTDGSKDDMKVGCALVSDKYTENMRIQMALQYLLPKQKILI